MADLAGGLLPEATLASSLTDHRYAGAYIPQDDPSSSLTDHRMAGGLYGSQGGGGSVTYWYSLRVRDDGVGPPAVYRVWSSTDPNSVPPAPPPVGAWVDRTVLDVWTL